MADTQFHLTGLLQDFLLSDIVQLIILGQKTGELRLRNTVSQQAGSLFFERENLTHAVCGDESGSAALATIAGWTTSSFSFLPDLRSPERTIGKPAMSALLEALHRQDELAEVRQRLPDDGTRLFIASEIDAPPQITSRLWKALALVNGRRSIEAICQAYGEQLEARKLLAELLAAKLVTGQPPHTDWHRLVPKVKPASEVKGQRSFPGRLRTNLLLKSINGIKSVSELRLELEMDEKVLWEELKYLIDDQWIFFPANEMKRFMVMEQEL